MHPSNLRDFSDTEHGTWRALFDSLDRCRREQAHPLFAQGIAKLGITGQHVPDLVRVNERLSALTGWRGMPVPGLEDAASFFRGLEQRIFPIGNFIRDRDDLGYTPAPDVFHDLYGHLPFLADPDYADFCQRFGANATRVAHRPEKLREYERLFWFGVEFPLIRTAQGTRIFGGGILSSSKESDYSLGEEPEVLPFEPGLIRRLDYRIDEMQKRLFLLESPAQLYAALDNWA